MIENIWKSRQTSTVRGYCLALRKFFSYLEAKNIGIVVPFDSMILAEYFTFLIDLNGTKGAMISAACSLKWFHVFFPGLNKSGLPINDDFINCLVDSVHRTADNAKKRKAVMPEYETHSSE